MSAMPIGMPGCPDFAASTASMARNRMALARSRRLGVVMEGSGWRARSKLSHARRRRGAWIGLHRPIVLPAKVGIHQPPPALDPRMTAVAGMTAIAGTAAVPEGRQEDDAP